MHVRTILAAAVAVFTLSVSGSRLGAQAATSICKDGTSSPSSGKGACSGHGGVDAKATAAAKKADVTCTDGTTSKAGRGACSSHGGVKSSTPAAKSSLPAAVPASSPARDQAKAKAPAATTAARPDDKDSTGAIALCKNGMYSHAATRKFACSKHGGVSKFLKS